MRLPEWLSDLLWVLLILGLMFGFAAGASLAFRYLGPCIVWYGRGPYFPNN
jgi:hypothetical protein